MENIEREQIAAAVLSDYFRRLCSRAGAAGKGKCKARSVESCQKARRKRSAKRASRTRDFAMLGRCGGATKGKTKARTTEQARAAALIGAAKRAQRERERAEIKGALIAQKFRVAQRERAKAFRAEWFT